MLGEILQISPAELKFPFELKKQVSTSLRLANTTSEPVGFKVKTTSPKKYCVRPNTGMIPPQSSTEVIVTMQAQKEAPPDMQCRDKFLVQSVLLPGAMKDAPQESWFNKDGGHEVHEVKLRVVFVAPPQPPSPVAEAPDEGNMHPSPYPVSTAARGLTPADPNQKEASELKAKLTEAKAALSMVSEERNTLQRENQLLKAQQTSGMAGSGSAHLQTDKRRSPGWSSIAVLLVAFLCLLIGYYAGKLPSSAAAGSSAEL